MDVIHKISIDFGSDQIPPHIAVMQKDSARKIEATLYENGVAWDVPSGSSAYIAFRRPDGKNFRLKSLDDGTSVVSFSNNVATVAIHAQVTEISGNVPVVIVFVDANEKQIATFPIAVSVVENPSAESEESVKLSPDEFTQLLSAISFESARIDNLTTLKEGSTTGDAELQDIRVGYNGKQYANAGEAVRGQVSQICGEISETNKNLFENYVFTYSENLIDVNTRYKDNYVIHENGVFEEFEKSYIWKIDTFKRGITYYFSCTTNFGANSHIYFLLDGGMILSSNVIGKKGNFVVTDTKIKSILLQDQCFYSDFFTNPDRAAIYLSEKDEYTRYEKDNVSQNIGFSKKQQAVIDDLYERMQSPLWGKKLVVNGDSICEGTVNGGGYAKIIGDMYNMTVQNVGVSGGTITADTYLSGGTVPRHWVCRTIDSMDADADYVLLEGGVNDASINVTLGEITQVNRYNRTLDDTTFYGAFESMLKQATLKYAGKKIAYVAVHKMTDRYNCTGDASTNLYHAAKKCCEKWGVPFIDLNVSVPAFSYFDESSGLKSLRDTYTIPDANGDGDGWHPNQEGYEKYYVPKIISWMESF